MTKNLVMDPKKKNFKLSKRQREVLVGLMLGDGSLMASEALHNKKNPATYRLVVLQSDKHKAYVFHLYEIFKKFINSPPKYYQFSDPRNPNRTYGRWSFSTRFQSCFRFYGQQFYKYEGNGVNRKKVVPKIVCKLLTPRSLAYWYMDDGAAKWQGKSKGLRFCTDNFTKSEVQHLILCLQRKFKLECSTQAKGGNDRIYVKSESYYRIKELIFNYLIPEMVHKFPRDY